MDESKFLLKDFDKATKGERVLVATKKNKVLGFVSLYLEDNFIHCLFILTEEKGLRIGSLLLKEAKKVLKRPMKLNCLSRNISALNFYESKGWRKIEEVRFENYYDS